MAKHKVYKTNPLRKYIILSLFIFLFIGIGYSILSTSLDLNGTISISKYDKTLYGVFEKEAKKGTYVKEYTGDHHDSFTEEPSKKIYSWYSTSDNMSTTIKNKYNVIFGNHCWHMFRTTDTGGVKMIYNGEAENGKCLSSRGTHVTFGYDFGYSTEQKKELSNDNYYGSSFSYDSSTDTFSITGNVFQSEANASTEQLLKRKYTCLSNSISGTCSTLYVVKSYDSGSTFKVIPIRNKFRYHGIGVSEFNRDAHLLISTRDSISFFGYMYKDTQQYKEKVVGKTYKMIDRNTLGTGYWYADSVAWDSNTRKWSLVNPFKVSNSSEFQNLVGKYTFRNTTETYTNSTVQYISAVRSNYYYYYVSLSSGNTDINTYKNNYIYGNSYIDNGDGTYTIPDYNTLDSYTWPNNYTYVNQQYICVLNSNNECNSILFVINSTDTEFSYNSPIDNFRYASTVTYENGMYKLSSDSSVFWESGKTENTNYLNTHHYTCWDDSDECETVYFIYNRYRTDNLKYIDFSNGATIDGYVYNMLNADDVNQNDSTIKFVVETWYSYYLKDYGSYIEDTIYCNDRLVGNYGGFSETGALDSRIGFNRHFRCPNETDMFSVSNPKAKLEYPIGLLTEPEHDMVLNSKVFALDSTDSTKDDYTSMTPYYYDGKVEFYRILRDGGIYTQEAATLTYVRPVISLKSGMKYTSGNGSRNNPYIIDAPPIGS